VHVGSSRRVCSNWLTSERIFSIFKKKLLAFIQNYPISSFFQAFGLCILIFNEYTLGQELVPDGNACAQVITVFVNALDAFLQVEHALFLFLILI
jgi:hypothetical protein